MTLAKKKYKLFIYLLLCLSIATVGFLAGHMYDISGVTFQNQINPLHAISIITPIIIAILLSVYLDKDKEDTKVVRNIFTTRIFSIDDTLNELYDKVNSNDIEYSKLTSFIKRTGTSLSAIQSEMKIHYSGYELTDQIMLIHKDIRELTTSTPIKSQNGSQTDVKCVKNIVTFSENRLSEISTKIESLRIHLFKLQLYINTA